MSGAMTPAEFLAAFSAACDIHRAAGETGDMGRELPAAIAVLERDAADPTLGPCARDAAALLRSWREGSIPPAD